MMSSPQPTQNNEVDSPVAGGLVIIMTVDRVRYDGEGGGVKSGVKKS